MDYTLEGLVVTFLLWTAFVAYLDAFKQYVFLVSRLIQQSPEVDSEGGLQLQSLSLTKEAKQRWIQCYNDIEQHLHCGGKFYSIKATASKAAENILRIADVFCVIEETNELTS